MVQMSPTPTNHQATYQGAGPFSTGLTEREQACFSLVLSQKTGLPLSQEDVFQNEPDLEK